MKEYVISLCIGTTRVSILYYKIMLVMLIVFDLELFYNIYLYAQKNKLSYLIIII